MLVQRYAVNDPVLYFKSTFVLLLHTRQKGLPFYTIPLYPPGVVVPVFLGVVLSPPRNMFPAIALAAALFWGDKLNTAVPGPYMDEEFHLRQTLTYLAGNWTQWDPKITTPPGLYVAGFGVHRVVEAVAGVCEVALPEPLIVLRTASTLLLPAVVYFAEQLLRGSFATSVRPVETASYADVHTMTYTALSIASMPFLFFFSAFYYTDVASLATLLLLLWVLQGEASWRGSVVALLCCCCALSLRQTNLVWVCVIYASAIFKRCGVSDIQHLITKLPSAVRSAFVDYPVVVVVLLASAAFIVINGGIVLGDKSNHTAQFHPTQLVYWMCLVGVFYPMFGLQALYHRRFNLVKGLLLVAVWVVFAVYCLKYYCVAHPFTLADNRHYTFYLWRRLGMVEGVAGVGWWGRYLLVPVSVLGFVGVADVFARVRRAWAVVFIGGLVAVLVPSPLYEPRYFIVPTALLVLVFTALTPAKREGTQKLVTIVHIVLHIVANVATTYLFLSKTFVSPDGAEGRIMW